MLVWSLDFVSISLTVDCCPKPTNWGIHYYQNCQNQQQVDLCGNIHDGLEEQGDVLVIKLPFYLFEYGGHQFQGVALKNNDEDFLCRMPGFVRLSKSGDMGDKTTVSILQVM